VAVPLSFFAPKIIGIPADFVMGMVIPVHVHNGQLRHRRRPRYLAVTLTRLLGDHR
jgi:hypothetical protein